MPCNEELPFHTKRHFTDAFSSPFSCVVRPVAGLLTTILSEPPFTRAALESQYARRGGRSSRSDGVLPNSGDPGAECH